MNKKKTRKQRASRTDKNPFEGTVDPTKILINCPHCEHRVDSTKELVAHWREYPCERYCTKPLVRQFSLTSYGEPLIIDPPNAEQLPHRVAAVAVIDEESRIALEVRRSDDMVTYVAQLATGLCVETAGGDEFDKRYAPIMDYPTGRCASLMVSFARQFGASQDAIYELSKLVRITDYDKNRALRAIKDNKTTVKTELPKPGERVKKSRKTKNSAATMFRNLVMEGGRTDTEIFAEVQKVFDLKDAKDGGKSVVSTYRSQLRKKGKNPPRALRVKKTAAAPAPTPAAKKPAAKKPAAKKPAAKKPAAKAATQKKRVVRL